MVLSGVSLAWFQEKFTCGSTRVRARFCRSVPVKYCPVNPPDRHMRRSSASTAALEHQPHIHLIGNGCGTHRGTSPKRAVLAPDNDGFQCRNPINELYSHPRNRSQRSATGSRGVSPVTPRLRGYNLPAMEKTTFGKTGFKVSRLGFGAGPIGFLATDQQRVANIINILLDSGVNVIDTAASYQGSEDLIGNAVSSRRSEYVLISKCGQAFPDLPGAAWSAEVITATVDRALRRLKTDHLDVMLLHSCELATLKKGEAIAALAKARDAGKIRFAGYSGDNDAGAYAAA